jgi:diguanylate cyclase (GGDEF)-like protein
MCRGCVVSVTDRDLRNGDLRGKALDTLVPALGVAGLLALFALVMVLMAGSRWGNRGLVAAGDALSAGTPAVLHLPGRGSAQRALTLDLDLPARHEGEPRRMLWLARDAVDELWLTHDGWQGEPLRFLRPGEAEGPLPPAYLFALPDHAIDLLHLEARGRLAVTLTPRVVGEDEAARWAQNILALNLVAYTGTFLLALVAIGLFWTVRERHFLTLFAASSLAGLLFAAVNGHLYAVGGLRALSTLPQGGLLVLALACAVGVCVLAGQIAGRARTGAAEFLPALQWGLGAVALLLLLPWAPLQAAAQDVAELGSAAAGIATVVLLAQATRRRVPMAMPGLLAAVIGMVAGALRVAVGHGWVADTVWTRYGFQVAVLMLLVVLGLGLIARIGMYREQRDREHDARLDSERRMQREAGRTALTRALQARLRELPPEDVEWSAFRLLLEHLLPHVPARRAAVIAHGYHGRDVVVAEPLEDRTLVDELHGPRLLVLRRQSMAGQPQQSTLMEDGRPVTEAMVPVPVGSQAWGALLLQREAGKSFSDEELSAAMEFARLTTLHADEAVATHALRRTAEVDALTGAPNRRSIDQWLNRHFSPRTRERALSLLFVDIDHFKRINDLHGHACGDHCLRQVAIALRSMLPQQDVLGRYGGEEFIALLPGTDVATARGMAERLRIAVEDCQVEWQGAHLRLSVSIGVATCLPQETAPALLDRADRALYAAKREGRNRVSVSPAVFPR